MFTSFRTPSMFWSKFLQSQRKQSKSFPFSLKILVHSEPQSRYLLGAVCCVHPSLLEGCANQLPPPGTVWRHQPCPPISQTSLKLIYLPPPALSSTSHHLPAGLLALATNLHDVRSCLITEKAPPLLGPSPGWKWLLPLSHLRIY